MAVTLLRVLVLGVLAAAADDVPVKWWPTQRASLACVVPAAERIPARRPPPPLDADDKLRSSDKPYVWKRGNEEIKKVLANGTLEVLQKKDGSTEGVYQCSRVLHHGGRVLGYPVNLKFAYIDTFLEHPENGTAWLGQPYTLSCNISSGPHAVITWLRNNVPLPKNNRYHMLQNQLLITDVQREDAGFYKCRATNPYVSKVRTSRAGRLQVEELTEELYPAILPIDDDVNIFAAKDSRVVLPCPVAGNPRPKITWQLTPSGDRTRELEDNDEVLVLPRIQLDQEGVYTCSVDGYSEIAKTFNVTVTEPVVITETPVSKASFRASTVRFNCTATGKPEPRVVWYKDGEPLVLEGRSWVLPSVNGKRMELLIRTLTSADAGVYQCFASNGLSMASAWGVLNVTGDEAPAPGGLSCRPTGPKSVALRWDNVTAVAYAIHITDPKGPLLPSQPVQSTEAVLNVDMPLAPRRFHVQAFIRSPITNKTIPSVMSESVTCQGQGVLPLKLVQLADRSMFVSWKQFADRNPDVLEWILQYKAENSSHIHNVTLSGKVNNYTLNGNVMSGPMQVRVLGSKINPWLKQDLSLVPWTSSAIADHDINGGEVRVVPENVEVIHVAPNQFTVRWRCDEADNSQEIYLYVVCYRKVDGVQNCEKSRTKSFTVKNLEPETEYEVQVQVHIPNRGVTGEFSKPIHIITPPMGSQPFSDLTYKVLNDSAIRVTWASSMPCKYTVHYSSDMNLPFQEWASVESAGNTAVLTDLDFTNEVYLMITGNEPLAQSSIIKIPAQNPEAKDIKYEFTRSGLKVWWNGVGPRIVRYTQNLTQPLDKWPTINVTDTSVTITGLDPSQLSYVMVSPPGPSQRSQVITIQARPADSPTLYTAFSIMGGVVVLIVLASVAFCIWKKRKNSRSPLRSHRRNLSPTESAEDQGSEMKNVGGRLANGGGSKDAGEPLLNGHVHITENPSSRTPNGRLRKSRQPGYEPAFDVARYEEPDTTLDTVLEADTSASTTFNFLDTSRRPEFDVSIPPREVNSFNKLPDDNMNSELNRSTDFSLDNSRILPTLQPNG